MRLTNAQTVDLYNVARFSLHGLGCAIEPINPKYRTKEELRALAEDVHGALAAKSDGDAKDHLFLAHWDDPALAWAIRRIAAFPPNTWGKLWQCWQCDEYQLGARRWCLVWGPVQRVRKARVAVCARCKRELGVYA